MARRTLSHGDRGASIVEMAVVLPLLVLILVGTVDFARVFFTAMQVTNAARAGAQYGAQSELKSLETSNMETKATDAVANIAPVSAFASRFCECATAAASFSSNDCSSSCGSAHMVMNVTVTAVKVFTTITGFPGIPHVLTISRSATLRVK